MVNNFFKYSIYNIYEVSEDFWKMAITFFFSAVDDVFKFQMLALSDSFYNVFKRFFKKLYDF